MIDQRILRSLGWTCRWEVQEISEILSETIENSSLYLVPFIIEFSMIGAHIVFNMWKNVGAKPRFAVLGENDVEEKGF